MKEDIKLQNTQHKEYIGFEDDSDDISSIGQIRNKKAWELFDKEMRCKEQKLR